MKQGNPQLRTPVLTVLAAAFSLMLITTTAQAAGEWKIGGKTLTELEKTEASITGTASEAFKLAVPWYASEITCTTLASEGGKILSGGGGHSTLNFSSCTLSGPPFITETCNLIEPVVFKVKDLLIYHNPDDRTYDLFQAEEAGQPLTTVQFKAGTECPLPLENEVTGSFVGETHGFEAVERSISVNSTTEKLFASHTLEFGSHPATLRGKLSQTLSGESKGLVWIGEVAQPKNEWKIGGKTLTELGIEKETILGSASETFQIIANGMIKLEVTCTALSLEEATILKVHKSGAASATIVLESCKLMGEIGNICEIVNPVKFKVIDWLLLHSGRTYHLLSPAEAGGWLITMEFKPIEPEGFCFYGGNVGFKGYLVGETEPGERVEQSLTFSPVIAALFPSYPFLFSGKTSSFKGKMTLDLSGESKGKTWTGIG
jgi:hypothetical protein